MKKTFFIFFFCFLFMSPNSYGQTFLLQSAANMQDYFLIGMKNRKQNLIILNGSCKECPAKFVAFINHLKVQYGTDFGFKAIVDKGIWHEINRELLKDPFANLNIKYFYFDPGRRLTEFAKFNPQTAKAQILLIQNLSIKASGSIDIGNLKFINQYVELWK